eukprot:3615686-Rhodomonas_salina.1
MSVAGIAYVVRGSSIGASYAGGGHSIGASHVSSTSVAGMASEAGGGIPVGSKRMPNMQAWNSGA